MRLYRFAVTSAPYRQEHTLVCTTWNCTRCSKVLSMCRIFGECEVCFLLECDAMLLACYLGATSVLEERAVFKSRLTASVV
jgi:hypothetical protein